MARRTANNQIQQYIWLVFAGLCLFGALVFWAITDTKDLVEVEKKAETEVELQIQPEKVASMHHLGALSEEVKPLDMTTRVVVTAQHESEFRGTKFIADHKSNYGVELFRVSDEDILKSFLKKQSERKNFIYLRLSGEDHPEQYVLLFGTYRSAEEAKQALADLKVTIPASVKPEIVQFEQYKALVNDLGSEELNSNAKVYSVNLKTVPVPRVDEVQLAAARARARSLEAAKAEAERNATTTTTVTRRDAEGNIVDVQKSQTSIDTAQPKAKPTTPIEHEVSDPFN